MNTVLLATWLVLVLSGVLTVLLTTSFFIQKLVNVRAGLMAMIVFVSAMLLHGVLFDSFKGSAMSLIVFYFALNAALLYLWRFHAARTTRIVRKNQVELLCIGLVIYAYFYTSPDMQLVIISLSGLILSTFVFMKILTRLLDSETSIHYSVSERKEKEWPSVSFAVPARNETHAMSEHLRSVLKTDYPKIEFLVLDDCSQDNTAQIIRSFSHDGVRFVQGQMPSGAWVGKTHAYESLAAESNGDYIIFSGVDTRYKEDSIRWLIDFMIDKNLVMISVMPGHHAHDFRETLIQPMRYLTMFLRSGRITPPTLSTVWVVKRDFLKEQGGLSGYRHSLVPERHLARSAQAINGYRFISFGARIGITSRKTFHSQIDTALRNIYPMIRRSVAHHLLITLAMIAMFVFPIASFFYPVNLWIISVMTLTLFYISYCIVVFMSYDGRPLRYSPVHFAISVATYYYLSFLSMLRYEKDEILWKDRNICEPVISGISIRKQL